MLTHNSKTICVLKSNSNAIIKRQFKNQVYYSVHYM